MRIRYSPIVLNGALTSAKNGKPSPKQLKVLTDTLKDATGATTQLQIVEALGAAADKSTLPSLIRRLDDSDEDVLCKTAEAIGKFKGNGMPAVQKLIRILTSPDSPEKVKSSIKEALRGIRGSVF